MKTFLKIIVGILIVLAIGVFALLANLNPIIEKLRPKIATAITDVVKQPAELGAIDVSIFPSPGISIENVIIKDGKSGDAAASVDSLFLKTGLGGLLKGKVTVETLQLDGALISLRKRKDGQIYLGEFPLTKKADPTANKPAETEEPVATVTEGDEGAGEESVDLAIKNVEIENVKLLWEDFSVEPKANVSFSDIKLSANNIGTSSKGTFDMSGTLLSKETGNIKVSGSIELGKKTAGIPHSDVEIQTNSIDLAQVASLMNAYGVKIDGLAISNSLSTSTAISTGANGIRVNPSLDATAATIIMKDLVKKESGTELAFQAKTQPGLLGTLIAEEAVVKIAGESLSLPLVHNAKGSSVTVKSESFNLSALGKLSPMVSKFALGGTISPDFKAVLPKEKRNSLIPAVLSGTLGFKGISVKPPGSTGQGITNVNGLITFAEDAVAIKPLSLLGGSGSVDLGFKGQSGVRSKINLGGLNLETISNSFMSKSAYSLTGTIESLASTVNTDINNPMPSLNGNASLLLKDGELKGFNIFRETLGKVTGIPGLGQALVSFVPEKYAYLTAAGGTKFDSISFDTDLGSNKASIKNFALNNLVFTIEGEGTAGFTGDLDMNCRLKLAPLLAAAMSARQPKLKLLQDTDQSIVIPIKILKDGAGKPIVVPDVKDLLKRAGQATAIEAGKRALDKVAPGLGEASQGIGNAIKSFF